MRRFLAVAVESEVALDLGCKYCARVYLAIVGRGGTSWLNQIIRDTGHVSEDCEEASGSIVGFEVGNEWCDWI